MDYYLYDAVKTQTALELSQLKPSTLHINSAGGDIFAALAIYNLFKNKNITIQIDGLCASAASVIACSGRVKMAENALFMIHLPAVGLIDYFNSDDLQKVQNSLMAIENSILMIYKGKTGRAEDELLNLMKSETWLSAAQAKELGFVDEITNAVEVKSEGKVLMERYKNSVLTEERGRIKALMALKSENPSLNALIDAAISSGDSVEKLTPYLNALKTVPTNNIYKNIIEDNLASGAEGVTGSIPEDKSAAQVDLLAKYINQSLGVKK